MLAYLAAPIDFVGDLPITEEWRSIVAAALIDEGFAIYDPSRPYMSARHAPSKVYELNQQAVRSADAVMGCLPPGVPTIGTPMEIADGHRFRKPVAVVGGRGSMQLNAMGIHCYHIEQAKEAAAYLRESVHRMVPKNEIRWTGDPACVPTRSYDGDAGFDLIVETDTTVHVDAFVDVRCGISVELPEGIWGLITGRSSTLRRRGLLVTQGIIDNGYRGELFAGVQHMGRGGKVELVRGERIAQFVPFRLEAPDLQLRHVTELSPSDRDVSGFGSTGA
jgi:deoxyuridine 5'-triphosphate nucleotidohydrolase